MDENQIIKECIIASKKTLLDQEVEFREVVLGTKGNHTFKQISRRLTAIHKEEEFNVYVETYRKKYKELAKKDPDIVVFEDCWLKLSSGGVGTIGKLVGCKCEFTGRILQSLTASEIKNSDLSVNISEGRLNSISIDNSVGSGKIPFGSNSTEGNNLNNCLFLKGIHLSNYNKINNCKFEELTGEHSIEIENSEVDKAAIWNSDLLVIKNSLIKNLRIQQSNFQNAVLFSNVVIEKPISISEIGFSSNNVNFLSVKFKDVNSDTALGSFRSLKNLCEEAHYEAGVILFHGYELETYYNVHLKPKHFLSDVGPEKFSSWFHKKFTNYGRNLIRPFYWLIGMFLFGFLFALYADYPPKPFYFCAILTGNFEFIFSLKNAFLFSLKNTLGPIMYALPKSVREDLISKNDLVNFYSFFQIIFSSIIWFLIVFMIRRRFKL